MKYRRKNINFYILLRAYNFLLISYFFLLLNAQYSKWLILNNQLKFTESEPNTTYDSDHRKKHVLVQSWESSKLTNIGPNSVKGHTQYISRNIVMFYEIYFACNVLIHLPNYHYLFILSCIFIDRLCQKN